MRYYNIYVDGMKDLFTYAAEDDKYNIGDSVVVPFRNIKKVGLIIEEISEAEAKSQDFKILSISQKNENAASLDIQQINLAKWLVSYYLCTYKAAISTILPRNIKPKLVYSYMLNIKKIKAILREEEYKNIREHLIKATSLSPTSLKAKFKSKVYKELLEKKYISLNADEKICINLAEIEKFSKDSDAEEIFSYFLNKMRLPKKNSLITKSLLDEEIFLIEHEIKEKKNNDFEDLEEYSFKTIQLNEQQKEVVSKIEKSEDKYFLIKGVTGSGKTEVYIELIKKAFLEGRGTIFLVPEISLTPQMVNRFKSEFKNNIAILHSKLSDKERENEWNQIYSGDKKIVLGVRNAIFAPVKNLKYIIIDEEHESTYKQEGKAPRYNAKYVAIKRVLLEDAKLVLGSATPSIESYFYAKNNIYELLTINERFGKSQMPEIIIEDMKKEEDEFFSKRLLEEIKNTLIRDEQVILLLNRKGYSTYIQCKTCGYVEECKHCSIKMTYYQKSNILKCNYCGKTHRFKGTCSNCGSHEVYHGGKGIERVEEELKKHFPVAIASIDGDRSKDVGYFEEIYKRFLNNEFQILIGTQIIAKGLHFPNVTLVGVINSDLILNFPDFRSAERTFQLLTQVSGRAGRGEKKGKVLIQTYQAENYAIKNSKEELYEAFYKKEIEYRKLLNYPPYSKIINIGISSNDENTVTNISHKFFNELKTLSKKLSIECYGPMPSMVYRVKSRYRYNIFIKGNKKELEILKTIVNKLLEKYSDEEKYRIVVDVDPLNLI